MSSCDDSESNLLLEPSVSPLQVLLLRGELCGVHGHGKAKKDFAVAVLDALLLEIHFKLGFNCACVLPKKDEVRLGEDNQLWR